MSGSPVPMRLNHAVLFVSDLKAAEDFYRGVFGMTVIDRHDAMGAAFLRFEGSSNHHDLGLFRSRTGPRGPMGSPGLYHLAWQVDTIDQLASFRERLLEAGAFKGESSHGATKSLYGTDADGNEFEIMWMLPRDHWGEYENKAVVEALDWELELRTWSGVATAGESAAGA